MQTFIRLGWKRARKSFWKSWACCRVQCSHVCMTSWLWMEHCWNSGSCGSICCGLCIIITLSQFSFRFQLVSSPAKNRLGMRLGLSCHSFAFMGTSLLWGSSSFTSSLSSVADTIPLPPLSQSFTLLSLQRVEHCLFRFCAVAPIFLLLHWFDNSSRVAVGIHVLKQLVV